MVTGMLNIVSPCGGSSCIRCVQCISYASCYQRMLSLVYPVTVKSVTLKHMSVHKIRHIYSNIFLLNLWHSVTRISCYIISRSFSVETRELPARLTYLLGDHCLWLPGSRYNISMKCNYVMDVGV